MLKYLRYTIYLGIAIAVFMAAYNIRMFIYVPHIENYLNKQTGHKFDISNFSLSPLKGGVSFSNVLIDGNIKAETIVVKISIKKIFKNVFKPVNYISDIEFNNMSVDLESASKPDEDNPSEEKIPFTRLSMPMSDIRISADVITFHSGKEIIKITNTEINAGPKEVFLSSVVLPFEIPFYVNGVMKIDKNNADVLNTEFTVASDGFIESIISVSGFLNLSDFTAQENIMIEKIKSKFFDISDSSGTIVKNGAGIKASFFGEFGNFSLERNPAGEIYAKSKISLSKINKDISADAESGFVYKDGEGNLTMSLKDLSVMGFGLGSFDVSGVWHTGGNYDIFCDYGKSGKMYCLYEKGGKYDFKMTFDGNSIGSVSGNLRTGEINVDIDNLPLSKLPVVRELSQNAAGTVTIKGALNETSGLINISLKNLETAQIGKTDIFGTITRSSDIYVFYFYKSDKSLVFNSVIKSGDILSTDFKFVNTDISNVLRAFGAVGNDITGNASGRIKYEKDGTTDFDIKAYDGSFYGNKYSRYEAKGDINLSRINISNFNLRGEDEQVSAFISGLIGFTNVNPVSALNIRMRKIKIGGALVDSDISFNGELNAKNEVHGIIASNSIKISGVSFNNFSTDAVISSDKLILSNIKSDNGLDGNLSCFFGKENGHLSGTISLKNTNISGFYPELEALINVVAKISGTIEKPAANIAVSVKKGKYSDIPFSFTSETSYVNDAFRIKNAELLSSRTKLSVKGKYAQAQKGALSVEFENLNEIIINKFVGFRTPIVGEFSGKGTLYQYEKGQSRLRMDVKSSKAFVKAIKLDNIKSRIEVYGSRISISSASARLADSEIRANTGSFNTNSGLYDLSMFLVNTHLGPVDVFGSININGKMNQKKGGSTYRGTIDIKNLWINKYKLSALGLDYTIKNKKFSISHNSGPLKVSGAADFTDHIKIEDLNIAKSSASITVNAFFKENGFNFIAGGKKIDLDFLSEFMDFPVDMKGAADFDISADGSFLSPEIKFAVKSNKGSVMDIPYDSIEFEIDSSGNKAEIKTARIFKKNEINVDIKGFFPFWIDDSLTKMMERAPVEIVYEADDSKMYLLKYLSKGEIKPKSGKIHVKGEISGTTSNIRNSGRMHVSNGVFDSKTYLDRMKDFTADIVWDDNNVAINKFSGKSGSGKLSVSGGLSLKGFNVQNFDIQVQTDNKGIPVKIPQLPIIDSVLSRGILQEFSSGEPRFQIKIQGTPEKPKISGWVSLENTRFSFPPPDTPSDAEDFLPDSTEFDIELKAAKNTKFENSFADAWINGSLFIRGTYAAPKPQGIIETQRGTIKYLGIVFDVINAKIEIVDENTLFVSGEADTNVYSPGKSEPEVIMLSITKSTIDNLNVRFYSKDDPTMDSQTALAKVTRTEQTVGNGSGNQDLILGVISDFDLRQQALRLIDSSFATPFARNVLRRTGIADNFKVSYVNPDQQVSNMDDPTFADLLYGTKYSVEKNITNQFLLGYSVTFDQIQKKLDLRHEVEMRYKLNNNLFLTGSYELESEDSLHAPDRRLMLQHQIRFGLPSNKRTKGARSGND